MFFDTLQGLDSSWNLSCTLPRRPLRQPGFGNNEVRRIADTDRDSPVAHFEPAGKINGRTARPVRRQNRTTTSRSSGTLPKVIELVKAERILPQKPNDQEPKVQEVKIRTIVPLASRKTPSLPERMAAAYERNLLIAPLVSRSTPSLPERMAAAYDRNRRKYVRARVG